MVKLLYSATISLDGFIAGTGGDMSWLTRTSGRTRSAGLDAGPEPRRDHHRVEPGQDKGPP